LRLKGGAQPARYYRFLIGVFHGDLASIAPRHARWKQARFLGVDTRPTPVWVPAGTESNALGYHKLRGGALRYEFLGREHEIVIDTMITWQGRWYITHLLPVKRR
jgi:hypothetical protein